MNELKDKIITFRAKNNLSQGDLANLCKVNVMTINNIETGKRKPSRLTRAKIEMIIFKEEN